MDSVIRNTMALSKFPDGDTPIFLHLSGNVGNESGVPSRLRTVFASLVCGITTLAFTLLIIE